MWGRAEVAYKAHNLVVGGSNPSPATIKIYPAGSSRLSGKGPLAIL